MTKVSEKIIEAVKKQPGQTELQISQILFGQSAYQQRVNNDCNLLVERGILKRQGIGGVKDPFRYYIVNKDSIRNALRKVLASYAKESKKPILKNSTATYLRQDFPSILHKTIDREDLIIKGSPGQGSWAEIPWVGIFNPEITSTAQNQYYVIYLFAADLSAVHLCLGQGVTEAREEYGKNFEKGILSTAQTLRNRAKNFLPSFDPGPINLKGKSSRAKDYNLAVAFHKKYDAANLPDEKGIQKDLHKMIQIYDQLASQAGMDNVSTAVDLAGDNATYADATIKEKKTYVRHLRIERNSSASKKVKSILGTICQGCGFDFGKFYGERGEGFIEAHHLTPLNSLIDGQVASMIVEKDFAVLCANCHRMVHAKKPMLTLNELRSLNGIKDLANRLKD